MIEDTDKCDNCNTECKQNKENIFRFSVAAEMLERTTAKGNGKAEQKSTVISIGFTCEMGLEEKDQTCQSTIYQNDNIGVCLSFLLYESGKRIPQNILFLPASDIHLDSP